MSAGRRSQFAVRRRTVLPSATRALRPIVCCLLSAVCCLPARAITFEELIARAARNADAPPAPVASGPSIRLETTTGVSRSQDLFFESPYESRSASAVVAIDYPLFNSSARGIAERIARNEAEQANQSLALSDADFNTLLDAYAGLWLANAESARTQSLASDVAALVNRGPELVQKGAINNITATQWEESSLALRSRLLDLELRRLDAETAIRQYVDDRVEPAIDFNVTPVDADAAVLHHPEVIAANQRVERARLAVEQVENRRRPDFAFSGFAGIGSANATFRGEQSEGTFGIYGLRLRMSYSLRDGAIVSDLSRSRRELARAEAERDNVMRRVRTMVSAEMLRIDAQRKRIELLNEAIDVSQKRQQSLVRLVAAGVTPNIEALRAAAETLTREERLDEARVEQWKAWQRLRRLQ
jgi:outer membrane protein TolC